MNSVIKIEDRYYILASSSLAEERNRVLKHDDTFGVFDRFGDVPAIGGEQGLYHEGARFLSSYLLTIGEDRPLLLSSTVRDDNATFTVDLTNPDLSENGSVTVPHGSLHVFRRKFLFEGVCHEQIRVTNYSMARLTVSLGLLCDADFVDVFEVRGMRRDRRGVLRRAQADSSGMTIVYEGLDGVTRTTRISASPAPHRVEGSRMHFDLTLDPKESTAFDVSVACGVDEIPRPRPFAEAKLESRAETSSRRAAETRIHTNNAQFNDWLSRSSADLQLMLTNTAYGPYPYAGIPWYSTPFGRDALLTALQYLWISPAMAKGVLGYLAATQARTSDDAMDAEPGKILHEARYGEMAALREIPFGRYYGSVDSTPLFVLLAGAYFERTDDGAFIASIWSEIELAMAWIETQGDIDGDGFVEYARHSADGLVQQGWKDSSDSIFHDDGVLARAPIALCEVQSYVYGAYRAGVVLARLMDRNDLADRWLRSGRELRRRFDAAFWCEDLGTYALALDGDKRQCRVRSSNAGHCLLTGLVSPRRAEQVANTLLSDRMFTGFGIRTLAEGEVRFDPMSYHNGSIWPHDNAVVAMGFARYGLKDHASRVLTGLFDASIFADLHRLPELFCGFRRRRGEGPTRYPVACSPQAWASASVFALLQAALGLYVDARRPRLRLNKPVLPTYLDEVHIHGLVVGPEASIDLVLRRHADDVALHVLRRDGPVDIVTQK